MSNEQPNQSRRRFVGRSLAVAGAAGLVPQLSVPAWAQSAGAFSEWGWPMPYKPISSKSVEWLKSKSWWPLQVAWNPLWSDGNLVLHVMQAQKLLEKRGIEVQYSPFLAASLMNEVYMPGRVQVAQAGSLGLLQVIDRKVPSLALACYPAQRQAFLVPPDSPLQPRADGFGLADLKDGKVLGRPGVVGVTIGSTTHLALLIAAKVHGLREGTDYILKNTPPADIITMPKGLDVVGIWEPNVLLMTEFRKNARIIDLINNYEFFNGYSYMRGEIEENAPDVVQAYTDAFMEARLYARYKPEESVAAFAADPSQRGRDPKLIERDATIHVFDPKPTQSYPFENAGGFWIPLELFQSGIMSDAGVLRRRYTEEDFKAVFRPKYMAATFASLGWAVPKTPPFVPTNWPGKPGHPPYPSYEIKGRQPFPEAGDLVRDWTFAGRTFRP